MGKKICFRLVFYLQKDISNGPVWHVCYVFNIKETKRFNDLEIIF